MPRTLLDLPHEILHNIFLHVDPSDLVSLSLCCHRSNDFVKSDGLLSKAHFLLRFDDPRSCRDWSSTNKEPSWEKLLHAYVRTGKILESKDVERKRSEVDFVADVIQSLVKTATATDSRNLDFLEKYLGDDCQLNLDIFVCGSSLFKWAENDTWKHHSHRPHPQNDTSNTLPHAEKDTGGITPNLNHVFVGGDATLNHDHRESPRDSDDVLRRRLFAKIHSLYGVPIQNVRRGINTASSSRYPLRSEKAPIHPYVRSKVYDLRQHSEGSFWGPFLGDGSQEVDWEKIEAIMLILDYNMACFAKAHEVYDENAIPGWDRPFKGASPYSFLSKKVSVPMKPSLPLEAQDPYNITGTWMRVVCFLDYTELYDFNFGSDYPAANEPRPPLDTEEATRLITMRIQVTKIEPPGEDDGQELPVVYFRGTSSSVRQSYDANANSQIKGMVKLTPQGNVRWTTWSIFHGEERWRSEGVQIGGVQSGRGVIGFWFDKDYDIHGPAGPTAFWKSHDGIEAEPKPTRLFNVLHGLHVPLG